MRFLMYFHFFFAYYLHMNLKQLRKSKKLTQAQAADLCGLSRKGYQNIEEGKIKKKNSPTLLYCVTRLEEYGKNRAPTLREIERYLKPILPGLNINFVYLIGGVQSLPNEEGPILFLIDGKLQESEIARLEDDLSYFFSKESEILLYPSCTEEDKKIALAYGVRLFVRTKLS